nr:nucleolar and coiled body phosphoprotein 1 [Hymenolepis microstoma]
MRRQKPMIGAGVKTPVKVASTQEPVMQQHERKKKDVSSSDSSSESSSGCGSSGDANVLVDKLSCTKRPRFSDSSLNSAPPFKKVALDVASVSGVADTSTFIFNRKRLVDDNLSTPSPIPMKKSKADIVEFSGTRKSLPSRLSNGDGDTVGVPNKSSGQTPKLNAPFLRYAHRTPESVHLFQGDNFHSRRQLLGEVGERADRNLLGTRGRSFRHEKTKEKRGTRSNGPISTKVASYQFKY